MNFEKIMTIYKSSKQKQFLYRAACAGIVSFIFAVLSSCTGLYEMQKRDAFDRVTQIAYYDGNDIVRSEEITYYGNSHNPSRIVYKKRNKGVLIPYKEEQYQFKKNNLKKLSFYIYEKINRIKTGEIKYFYKRDRPKRIEYYSLNESRMELHIFGLDQYKYKKKELKKRRIIQYELNPKTGKAMQVAQYVVYYKSGAIIEMKSWVMDKKSKKVIEKKETNSEKVYHKLERLEKRYIKLSRGRKFLER